MFDWKLAFFYFKCLSSQSMKNIRIWNEFYPRSNWKTNKIWSKQLIFHKNMRKNEILHPIFNFFSIQSVDTIQWDKFLIASTFNLNSVKFLLLLYGVHEAFGLCRFGYIRSLYIAADHNLAVGFYDMQTISRRPLYIKKIQVLCILTHTHNYAIVYSIYVVCFHYIGWNVWIVIAK